MKKRPLDRTKVVWRHLPPSITQAFLTEQIDNVFSGRYDWVSFRPGKSSQKRHTLSRAYIKFKRLEDVTEFAGFFNGHVFVNEKGAQFKTIVEYAPFQRVPTQRLRKDSREGTLITDPEYIEFLKFLVTPVKKLPSAEIQPERREAERSGAAEGVPIVTTPLMDYVRRKRASKRSRTRGKLKKKAGKSSAETMPSLSSQLNAEKRRTSTTAGAVTDTARNSCSIEKTTCNLIAKVEKLQLSNKSNTLGPTSRAELLGGDSEGSIGLQVMGLLLEMTLMGLLARLKRLVVFGLGSFHGEEYLILATQGTRISSIQKEGLWWYLTAAILRKTHDCSIC